MGVENRIEDLGQEGNCSLGNMLQGAVWDTVRARSLADLEKYKNMKWTRTNFGKILQKFYKTKTFLRDEVKNYSDSP